MYFEAMGGIDGRGLWGGGCCCGGGSGSGGFLGFDLVGVVLVLFLVGWRDGSRDLGDGSVGVGQVIANVTRGGVPIGLRRGFWWMFVMV